MGPPERSHPPRPDATYRSEAMPWPLPDGLGIAAGDLRVLALPDARHRLPSGRRIRAVTTS